MTFIWISNGTTREYYNAEVYILLWLLFGWWRIFLTIVIIVRLTRDYRLLEVFINDNTVIISFINITGFVLRPKFCKTIFMCLILFSIQSKPDIKKKPIKLFFSPFVHINSIFSCSTGLECSGEDQTLNETVRTRKCIHIEYTWKTIFTPRYTSILNNICRCILQAKFLISY